MKKLLLYIILFLLCACALPWVGASSGMHVSLADVWDSVSGEQNLSGGAFIHMRVPRVLLALLVGGTLALSGGAFQILFRNSLVEPYTLGISGGAALGAFVAITFPVLAFSLGPVSSVQIFAIVGACGALAFIASFAAREGEGGVTRLLLAGVTISIICGGAIMLITLLANPTELVIFQRWLMGELAAAGWSEIGSFLPFLLPGAGLVLLNARSLNHLTLGDEMALGHGVDVRRVRLEVFLAGGIAAAAAVSVSGPIGFIGLIVPHAVRRLSGYDQRVVLPACFLLGGSVLAVCDTFARILIFPTEIPVGVITAVVGGPLFVRLISKPRRAGESKL